MNHSFTQSLAFEKKELLIAANGGISLMASGFIYWLGLGLSGFYLSENTWSLVGFASSGLIFPLGLALSNPLKSDLLVKNPLTKVVLPAMSAMFLCWPMIIVGYFTDPSLVPLFLTIGMTLHWPVIGWMYNSKVCLFHAITRVVVVTVLWFSLPELRFTLLPLAVSFIYLLTIFGVKQEIKAARNDTILQES